MTSTLFAERGWASLDGVTSDFAGADTDHGGYLGDPNFAVSNLAGTSGVGHGLNHRVHLGIINDDFETRLRGERDLVFGAPVGFGVTALAAVTLCLGHGHALDSNGIQLDLDLVDLVGFDDGGYELHVVSFP
jgi:hypothetical protein